MFQIKVVEKLKHTHFIFSNFFPPENRAVYESVEKFVGASEATNDNMAHARCTLDKEGYTHQKHKPAPIESHPRMHMHAPTPTHTHARAQKYEILIPLPLHQVFRERASVLRHMNLACLNKVHLHVQRLGYWMAFLNC